jgi:hypothetical protein
MGATITLDAATDYELVAFTVAVSAPVGAAKAEVGRVAFSDAIGSPPVTATMVCAECGSGVPPAVMTPAVISTEPTPPVTGTRFVPGSANGDGRLDIADGIFVLSYLFRDGPDPKCLKAADANGDCEINLADAVAIIYYLLQPGVPPATPYSAPSSGVGCTLVMGDECPALSCEVAECTE